MTDGGYQGNPEMIMPYHDPVTDNRRCRGGKRTSTPAPRTPPAASPSCATWPARSDRPPRGAITYTTNAFAHYGTTFSRYHDSTASDQSPIRVSPRRDVDLGQARQRRNR